MSFCTLGLRKNVSAIALFTMLDGFEILTTSGVILWSKSYVPVNGSIINGFVKDVFIEEIVLPAASVADDTSATQNPSYKKDQYTLKWTSVKDLGLIFVVRTMQAWSSRSLCSLILRLFTNPCCTCRG